MDLKNLKNPVWRRSDNLRDPSVHKSKDGYHFFIQDIRTKIGVKLKIGQLRVPLPMILKNLFMTKT